MRWLRRWLEEESCRVVVVDGEPAVVRGSPNPSTEAQAAIADIIRAARTLADNTPEKCHEQEPERDGYIVRFPCTRDAGHDPPHRTRSGRAWLDTEHGPVRLEGEFTPGQLAAASKVAGMATAALAEHAGADRCHSTNASARARRPCMREADHAPPHQDAMGGQW